MITFLFLGSLATLGALQCVQGIPFDNQPFTPHHRQRLRRALLTFTILIILTKALA